MESMTTSVIDKNTPRVVKNTAKQRQEEEKAAEEEQSAILDARNELLKPEPIDKTALQTSSSTSSSTSTKGNSKFIEETGSEREGDKLGEIIRENADAAAMGSLDHGQHGSGQESRASLS
jgi:hypothetical protein